MSKNFMQDGKWIDNPNTINVTKCKCGNKYIRTREGQLACLRCISEIKRDTSA